MTETNSKKVLFICEGNVGRSQMAEGFYKHYTQKDAVSAGISDVGAKYDFKPRLDIVLAMQERGIDISHQRIKQITKDMLADISTILVLCKPNLLPDFIASSALPLIFREVADPFESSIEGVRTIRDEIEKIIFELFQS